MVIALVKWKQNQNPIKDSRVATKAAQADLVHKLALACLDLDKLAQNRFIASLSPKYCVCMCEDSLQDTHDNT